MCQYLLPGQQIDAVRYYTAIVSGRPDDPDKPTRQQIYVRALRTLPGVTVSLGKFLSHAVNMPLVNPRADGPRCAHVIKTEEKGTDVTLATHLLHDAHMNRYDVAVLVSNDSDLTEPLRIVREELRKKIGIINPRGTNPSRSLMAYADFVKQIRPGLLAKCELSRYLKDEHGEIHRPDEW